MNCLRFWNQKMWEKSWKKSHSRDEYYLMFLISLSYSVCVCACVWFNLSLGRKRLNTPWQESHVEVSALPLACCISLTCNKSALPWVQFWSVPPQPPCSHQSQFPTGRQGSEEKFSRSCSHSQQSAILQNKLLQCLLPPKYTSWAVLLLDRRDLPFK
jgi:hypothetical protein